MKTIQAELILEEKEWKYGPVYVVFGNSYLIKNELEKLGFKPYKMGNIWVQVMNKNTFNSFPPEKQKQTIQTLKSLNINVSKIFSENSQSSTDPLSNTEPAILQQSPNAPLKGEEYPYSSLIGRDKEEKTRLRYNFPIEKNILSYDITFDLDGETHTENVKINRTFKPGATSDQYNVTFDKEYQNFPIYEFEMGKIENSGNPIKIIKLSTKGEKTQKPWGTYDEKKYLEEELKPFLIKLVTIKYPHGFRVEYDIRKRQEDLKEFLKGIEYKFDSKKETYFITIDEDPYKGNYPVAASFHPDLDLYLETSIKHPLAPYPQMLTRVEVYKVHTVEELNKLVQETLSKPEIKNKYVEYLKSFPFLEQQKDSEKQKFETILNAINNKSMDILSVIRKLKEIGYIRPNKKQKTTGPGLTSGTEISWILDQEKIRDDIYNKSYLKSTPDFFYSVLAYYILKAKNNQWSWTDMILIDSIKNWLSVMKKFGAELNFQVIEDIISALGEEILKTIWNKETKTRRDQFYDFYYGFSSKNQQPSSQEIGVVSSFKEMAKQNSVDTNLSLKRIYYALAQKLHPDKYIDPKQKIEAEEKFKQLQEIWDLIPENLKIANNWYQKIQS